ncbi:DUF6088 family protein [Flavivirga sp. 57AJ16]|uniref:DUF6088 family protein n=1 Tax=Flavivirga sp. 57AJ16 TaxID=3025307 RepID=UPI002366442E|nr:DUF6088 family protein [Flavivirga sp. 57AJ16]MDD7886733.1 DUF6088 family protein [Flavivirga sp. 57AJ16]
MKKLNKLVRHLRRGSVYRRGDLEQWSNAVDRHLGELVQNGTLQKLSQGLYHYPKETPFGLAPPKEEALVRSFLKEDAFLLTSPNAYNALGVGTTQLYNKRVVYNHKRHGEFELGGRTFFFHVKPRFPKKLTSEFLLVDLVNNLETLAEDPKEVLSKVKSKVRKMDAKKLQKAVKAYGGAKAKKVFMSIFNSMEKRQYAQ